MKPTLTSLLLTAAGFAAGWAGVHFWPAAEIPVAAATAGVPRPSAVAVTSPAATAKAIDTPLARQLRARQQTATLTAAEAKALLTNLPDPLPPEEQDYWQQVITLWAEAEPQAAAHWLRTYSRRSGVPQEWAACLAPLARRDLRAALTAAKQIYGYYNSAPLIEAAAARDPRGTLALCETMPHGSSLAGPALGLWLRADADDAFAWLYSSPLLKDGSFASAAVSHLSALAPERIEELLTVLPEGARAEAASTLASMEVQRDPAAALVKFTAGNPEERAALLQHLAGCLSESGTPEEVGRFLTGLSKVERTSALSCFGDTLGTVSTDRLLALLKAPEFTPQERNAFILQNDRLGPEHAALFMAAAKESTAGHDSRAVLNYWRHSLLVKPAETAAAMRTLIESGGMEPEQLLSVTRHMSESGDSQAIRDLLPALPEEFRSAPQALLALRDAAANPDADLSGIAQELPDAVRGEVLRAYFQRLEGAEDRTRAASVLQRLAPAQQIEALSYFPIQGADTKTLAPLVRALIESSAAAPEDLIRPAQSIAAYLSQDNGAAMQWADTLPDGTIREAARGSAFVAWVQRDAPAASEWLDTQPRDFPKRDEMVHRLASQISATDPESAWHWAATITDPSTRRSLQEMILPKWLATDPAAARAAQ